jgi:hypothetical protein
MGRSNILFEKTVTTTNRFPTTTTLSNDGTNNAAIIYNPQEDQYEMVVNVRGHICEDNTTLDNLSSGGIFTGDWQDTLDYINVAIGVSTNQDSATDGLIVQWSTDGVSVNDVDTFTILANKPKIFTFQPARRYVRVQYTNGATATTSFNIETRLSRVMGKPSSHRIQDNIVGQDDAELVKAVNTGLAPDGTFKNVNVTNDADLLIADNSNGLSIARGNVTGATFIHKFGNAPDFDITDGFVTVWDGADDGGLNEMQYTYSGTAIIDSLVSSSSGDTQDIEILGLDSNYDLITQTRALTGQTRVALTTNLIRVFRLKNRGNTDIVGDVYCYENTAIVGGIPTDTTKVRAIINNGNNQTLMSLYTVPAGKTAYMRDWYASTSGARKTSVHVVKLKARPFGEVFQLKHTSSIIANGTSYIQHKYEEPEIFTEKTDIEMTVNTDEDIASISGGFDIVLIDN